MQLMNSYVHVALRGHPFMTSTRRRRGQAQVDACGRGGGQAPCGRPNIKLKLESTDVIFSSVCVFFTKISSLEGIKSGNFSAI